MQASCNAFITPTLMQLLCNAFVYSLIFVIMRYIHILCIANCLRWKSCAVFVNRSVMRNFSSELVIMPLCNTQDYHATANIFQWITVYFSTAKLFHLEWFAIYGIVADLPFVLFLFTTNCCYYTPMIWK